MTLINWDSDDVDGVEEAVLVKRPKKSKTAGNGTKLDTLVGKATTSKPSKVKSMQPRSPPKLKKIPQPKIARIDSDESEDEAGPSAPVAPKKRSPRRAAKAPAKYVEVSSEGDWNGGEDESFNLED
jgi:DNA topoisomerase-2